MYLAKAALQPGGFNHKNGAAACFTRTAPIRVAANFTPVSMMIHISSEDAWTSFRHTRAAVPAARTVSLKSEN